MRYAIVILICFAAVAVAVWETYKRSGLYKTDTYINTNESMFPPACERNEKLYCPYVARGKKCEDCEFAGAVTVMDLGGEYPYFDREEIVDNCTVQILENTETGDVSVGWWKNVD